MKNTIKIGFLNLVDLNTLSVARFFVTLIVFCLFSTSVYASDVVSAVKSLASSIIGISTGAAAIGVGSGFFIKVFSFGKQERLESGNKLIRESILGWCLLNGLGVILSWVNVNLLGGENIDIFSDLSSY